MTQNKMPEYLAKEERLYLERMCDFEEMYKDTDPHSQKRMPLPGLVKDIPHVVLFSELGKASLRDDNPIVSLRDEDPIVESSTDNDNDNPSDETLNTNVNWRKEKSLLYEKYKEVGKVAIAKRKLYIARYLNSRWERMSRDARTCIDPTSSSMRYTSRYRAFTDFVQSNSLFVRRMSYLFWQFSNQDYLVRVFRNFLMKSGRKYLATKVFLGIMQFLKFETMLPPYIILRAVLNKTKRPFFNIKTVSLKHRNLYIPSIASARSQFGVSIRNIIKGIRNVQAPFTNIPLRKGSDNTFVKRCAFFLLKEYLTTKAKYKGKAHHEVSTGFSTDGTAQDDVEIDHTIDTLTTSADTVKTKARSDFQMDSAQAPLLLRYRVPNEYAFFNRHFFMKPRRTRTRYKESTQTVINTHVPVRMRKHSFGNY